MTETYEWTQTIRYKALASRVLVVARTRVIGEWEAYCDAVPGDHHEDELQAVLARGDPVDERIARILFPEFKELPYAD